ncbi:GSCFA family protein [gut metagenome]|uniref:GSCFA family protein n=1 Tax=gut metagenome TaxID=749906 RepID=J9GKA9_9ZZZZ
MGSCFAENMGNFLREGKFQVDMNPFGILYNPLSIGAAWKEIRNGKVYEESDLFFYKGLWHSSMHHSIFSAESPRLVLQRINDRLQQACERVQRLDWLMLTFGTAYVYEQKDTGRVVANCHKLPEELFTRRLLSVDEIVDEYQELIADLTVICPQARLLFTVSPIRHQRDGMHANQLSKATLLLAIDRLQQLFPGRVWYFPSYEIVLDELRDYRFFAEDMVHPSPLAVRYLWQRFSATCFPAETLRILEAVEDIRRDLEHRPFHPHSEVYHRFLGQIVLKIERLIGKYPYLDFQKEIELCHIRLNP